MTPQQHVTRVRQAMFQLERADYGLGMPRDYQLVCALKVHVTALTQDAMTAIHDAFVNGPLSLHEATALVMQLDEDEAVRIVEEWAEGAEAQERAEAEYYDHDDENIYGSASMRQSIEEDRR